MASASDIGDPAPYRLRQLGMSFGGVFACQGVDMDFRPGEIHALMGENGAGKSTTMKCLAGLYTPTEGSVEVDGESVRFRSPRDAERRGIALIPQELDLFPELSIAENMFLGASRPRTRWGGIDHRAMREAARAALDRLGANFDPGTKVKHLSAANGKLVEIARALTRDARLLIMDEPTASLTEREVSNLFRVIRDLRARGMAVVYISHRLDEVFALCDRITVLRDGRLIASDPVGDTTPGRLVQTMVGRPINTLFSRIFQPPGPVVLAVEGLGRGRAFRDVSFSLHGGEILGVSGLIGAGRTEVALALFGVAPADSGTVRLRGAPLTVAGPRDAMKAGIAYLPEERRAQGLVLDRSIEWNVSIGCLGKFSSGGLIDGRGARAFAARSTAGVGVKGGDLASPVSHLSGGNQQKVVLARTLALDPDIVILDEPTRGVDVGAKSDIYRIIDGLARSGKAILMISSELNELMSMCDRVLVMREGSLVGTFDRPFSAEALGAAAAGAEQPLAEAVA